WPPGRSAGSSPVRGLRRPQALLAPAAGRRNRANSGSDTPDPQDRTVRRAAVPKIDAGKDRPCVIALRIEQGLRDLPLPVARGSQIRQVVQPCLGSRKELSVAVEELGHRGLEALVIPAGFAFTAFPGFTRSLPGLRALMSASGRLLPVFL